jgi:hypothetical protein
MDETVEHILVGLAAIAVGCLILFSPYWLGDLFVTFTEESAKRDDKIPQDIHERRRWFVRMLWRGWWMYFVLVSLFLLTKLWDLFTRF